MQGRIRSKWDDFDLLLLHEKNQIYHCFELVGIYKKYLAEVNRDEDFENWYLYCIQQNRYFYRNSGVREVYEWIKIMPSSEKTWKYHISKRSMRRYGITYTGENVVFYEGTYIVLKMIVDYIQKDDLLKYIYEKYILKKSLKNFITFQDKCLQKFISYGNTNRKKYYADIREQLRKLLEE